MQQHPRKLRTYVRIFLTVCLALLILLSLFQWIWVLGGSGTSIMYRAGLQRDLTERITKDVLTLAYRPITEHPQAINELQNTLPAWEHGQHALQTGDPALALPRHPPDTILQLMISSQPDFAAIDTAARQIIAHPDKPVDPVEVDIIVAHERDYFLTLAQVNTAWQQYIDGAFLQIFWIEEGLVGIVVGMLVGNYFLVSRRVYNRIVESGEKESPG